MAWRKGNATSWGNTAPMNSSSTEICTGKQKFLTKSWPFLTNKNCWLLHVSPWLYSVFENPRRWHRYHLHELVLSVKCALKLVWKSIFFLFKPYHTWAGWGLSNEWDFIVEWTITPRWLLRLCSSHVDPLAHLPLNLWGPNESHPCTPARCPGQHSHWKWV